jgi:hypothetical protein
VESTKTNLAMRALPAVTLTRSWTPMASGHCAVRLAAPYAMRAQGTGVSAASALAAQKATDNSIKLPIFTVVVTDDGSGIRTWDPPV